MIMSKPWCYVWSVILIMLMSWCCSWSVSDKHRNIHRARAQDFVWSLQSTCTLQVANSLLGSHSIRQSAISCHFYILTTHIIQSSHTLSSLLTHHPVFVDYTSKQHRKEYEHQGRVADTWKKWVPFCHVRAISETSELSSTTHKIKHDIYKSLQGFPLLHMSEEQMYTQTQSGCTKSQPMKTSHGAANFWTCVVLDERTTTSLCGWTMYK